MLDKFAEEFGVSLKKAKQMVERALDMIFEEVKEKGKCFCGRKHYFKRVDKPARRFFNVQTKQLDTTEPTSYVMYRKQVTA